ncbi:hypothetical protein [Mollivirus kamchatka]|nr:hypothetical protein [Mollivirus kamchatka]
MHAPPIIHGHIEHDQSWLDRKMSQLFGSLLRRILDDDVKELELVCSLHEHCTWRLVLGPLVLSKERSHNKACLIDDDNKSFALRGTFNGDDDDDDGRVFRLTVKQDKEGQLSANLEAIRRGKPTYQKVCVCETVRRKHKQKAD